MSIESGSRYIITNKKGETVIDLSEGDNRSITGYPENGGPNQQWETLQLDGGRWFIRNVANNNLYLSFEGGAGDGIALVASEKAFQWDIWNDQGGYRICAPGTVFNIDLTNYGDSKPGTPVELWGRWDTPNQVWLFKKVN